MKQEEKLITLPETQGGISDVGIVDVGENRTRITSAAGDQFAFVRASVKLYEFLALVCETSGVEEAIKMFLYYANGKIKEPSIVNLFLADEKELRAAIYNSARVNNKFDASYVTIALKVNVSVIGAVTGKKIKLYSGGEKKGVCNVKGVFIDLAKTYLGVNTECDAETPVFDYEVLPSDYPAPEEKDLQLAPELVWFLRGYMRQKDADIFGKDAKARFNGAVGAGLSESVIKREYEALRAEHKKRNSQLFTCDVEETVVRAWNAGVSESVGTLLKLQNKKRGFWRRLYMAGAPGAKESLYILERKRGGAKLKEADRRDIFYPMSYYSKRGEIAIMNMYGTSETIDVESAVAGFTAKRADLRSDRAFLMNERLADEQTFYGLMGCK
jgi:hypothetical protein